MSLNQHKLLNLQNVDNSHFLPLCQAYARLVSYWSTITNIISSGDVDNLLVELIEQSVTPLREETISEGARVLDVGSGAGIPALPIKFARPDLDLILLEARRKKAAFLRWVVDELKLEQVCVLNGRLEAVFQKEDWRGAFDLVTTRGTGSVGKLFPLLEPLVRPGGTIWFYKGVRVKGEVEKLSKITSNPIRLLKIAKTLSLIIVDFQESSPENGSAGNSE